MSLLCEMLVDLPCFVSLPFCYKIEFWLVVRIMQDKIDRLTWPFWKSATTVSVTLKKMKMPRSGTLDSKKMRVFESNSKGQCSENWDHR